MIIRTSGPVSMKIGIEGEVRLPSEMNTLCWCGAKVS